MVHFMGPANPAGVPIIGVPKNFEPLVDKDIMYQKIGNTVGQNSKSEWPPVPKRGVISQKEQGHAHHGIKQKKGIIALKPWVAVLFMIVFVQAP